MFKPDQGVEAQPNLFYMSFFVRFVSLWLTLLPSLRPAVST
jgi:hypothetical protein